MATLTIGDKSVEVDDTFLKLSPAEQESAVADIAKSIGASAAPAADPITTNQVVRATATGVPIVGGLLNQANAVTNAALAPILNPLFEDKDQLRGRTFAERRAESLRQQEAMDKRFEEQHPVVDTLAKVAGGVGGTIPAMMAAPAAFGLTGPMSQMVVRGAASNAALGAVDAAVRGESVAAPALIGGVVGAGAPVAGHAVGRAVRAVREFRSPTPVTPQFTEEVAGVKIPMSEGQATGDPVKQAQEEIFRRGEGAAERVAREADQDAEKALAEATEGISRMMDPTGTSARTAPQAAGQVVQQELAARAAAEEAARAAQVSQVAAEGESLARGLGGGAAPVSPFDAAETTGAAVARARDAKVAATREAYKARDAVPGTFDESVPQTLAEDIRARLNTGDEPLWVDPTNESTANKALKLIDQTIGKNSGLLRNSALPETPPPVAAPAAAAPAAAKATEDETVAALRKQYGDEVADKYAMQAGVATKKTGTPISLLEFVASKGGLKPDAELEAIGLNQAHRQQVPGQKGFFGTVRKNGSDIDRMREAAEEAGYLRGENGATSTPRQFLDALDAELRGQKLYPESREGFVPKKAAQAQAAAARSAEERIAAGFEQDLAAAGHGELGAGMRERAVALMRDEGMAADDAVETAFRQLEQEDAVAAARAASDFPGDRPMVSPGAERAAAPVDLKAMDEARKRLVTMFGDAKSRAIASGDKSDMRAMGKILNEFDNVIAEALESGKFTGDAKLATQLQADARRSHAEYRQTFSSRGPGDEIGRNVEKILGRYADNAAPPEEVLKMAYGPASNPGTGKTVLTALRLRQIVGENSAEWGRWKQGLFSYVTDTQPGEAVRTPAKIADRVEKFLQTSLARGVLSSAERGQLSTYARNLRAIEPAGRPANELEKAVARIAGTDGHLPATPLETADLLYSRTGKGDKGISQRLASHLKQNLTPESWVAVKQGMWEKLVNAGEGKIPYGPQALAQRMNEFLNESGKGLAQILFTKAERAEMAKLASVYKRMTPAKGTTNPSGSATIGAKIAGKALDNLGAMLGFGAGGIPGAIAGHVVQKGGAALKDARAGREATRLFFGPQPRAAVRMSRVPVIAAQAIPASQR
jgi:hypothetical protein